MEKLQGLVNKIPAKRGNRRTMKERREAEPERFSTQTITVPGKYFFTKSFKIFHNYFAYLLYIINYNFVFDFDIDFVFVTNIALKLDVCA